METSGTYVYFALTGDSFDPKIITDRIGIEPTESWIKGDKGKYNPRLNYSCWQLSTDRGKEDIGIGKLVDIIISRLNDKIDIINHLKLELKLESVLEIVLDIDTNPDKTTPALGFDSVTIEFLYKTKTIIDIDIYRFNSQ